MSFHDASPILAVESVPRAIEPLGIGIAARAAEVAEATPRGGFEQCIYNDSADAATEQLAAAGAEQVLPPTDEPWAERRTYFRDLDSHLLHVCAKLEAAG